METQQPNKKIRRNSEHDIAKSFTPRDYQIEILEAAKRENVIACLGTGTGKTFIAVMLIRENANEVRLPFAEGGKRIFFLVPTVPLVLQQRDTINDHTDLKVQGYYGEMDVDSWSKEQWEEQFENFEVLVMTAEIFRIIVDHAFIPLSKIKLLVIDECHRAQKDHPYRQAMKCFLNADPSEVPKIFGLSASLLNGKCKPSQLEKNLQELEKTLRSTIITASDVSEIQKYGTDPEEIAIFYHASEFTDSDLKEEILNLSNELKLKKSEFYKDETYSLESDLLFEKQFRYSSEGVIFFDKPLRCLNALGETLENLGLWCACTAAKIYLKEVTILCDRPIAEKYQNILKKVQKFLEDFIKKCDILLQEKGNSMPHKLERLLEIFFAVKQSKKFMNELPHTSDVTFAEDPEKYFVNIKQSQEYTNCSDVNVCSIVFVEQRITAYVLYQWILYMKENYPSLAFLKPNFIVGHGRVNLTETSMTEKKQKEIVSSFRKKECNILIATCVLEEGMDIRQCNLVIRFDLPKDFRSYVQSKGRARAKNSVYVLMVQEGLVSSNFLMDISNFKTIEKMLLSKCHNRAMPSEEEISVHMADSLIPPYMPYGPRGARITMTSSISLINRYCANLPCDMATKLTPRWEIKIVDPESNEKEYYCRLRMPINSPLRQIITGDIMKQKRLAKMAAALKACKLLNECGELNEHLVPVSCLVDKALEEELGPAEKEITDGAQPGTNRRKQVYKKHVPIFLQESRPAPGIWCYLHIFEMDLVEPLPDCLNPRNRPLFNPKTTTRGVALLSSKILPSVNPFPIFTKSGRILVKIHALEKPIILVDEQLKKLEEFHKFIFSDALWLDKDKEFSPQSSVSSYYIVPVNKDPAEKYDIDWSFIDATEVHPYNDIKHKTLSTITRTHFDAELFKDSVLMRSYKMHEWENTRPTFHHVIRILYDKSPQSRMNSESFKDYYKRKYNLEILNDKQPLVETVQSGGCHFWKPLYVSGNEIFEDTSVLSKTKQRHMNYREYLVPELCIIHPFPSPFFYKVLCLPSILFRLHSLLLAEEIRQNVASQGFIGSLHLKPNYVWPEFNLETSDKPLKEQLYKNGHIEDYIVRNVTKPKDVIKNDGKISSFEVKIKLSDHPGPEPSLILQALTSKSAGDEFDLERLEMIGDSFLKYVMSLKTYYKYPTFDEGKLSKLRSGLIQNLHLYQVAKIKKLAEYLICTCFSCNTTWLPPCFIVNETIKKISSSQKAECDENDKNAHAKYQHFTKQVISDKCVADSVEALIGVYLLSCGQQGALRFMYWLGLNPLLKNSCICNYDFESWPPIPPDPVVAMEVSKDFVYQSLSRLTSGFNRFEKNINYTFKNKAYLLQAFTHPSYVYNEITDCYQRLEFLGDAVLDYVITRQLYEDPNDHSPGMLTDLRSALVNNVFFAWQAVKHKYHEFLKMLSPHLFRLLSDYVERLKNSDAFKFFEECGYYLEEIECFELDEVEVPKALGDIFESVAGAIYLDSGMSLDAVWRVYYPMIEPALKHLSEHVPKSPVRELYEILKKKDVFSEPVQKSGKTYIEVEFKGKKFVGVGPNKKVAKKSAAKRALAYLKYKKEEAVAETSLFHKL